MKNIIKKAIEGGFQIEKYNGNKYMVPIERIPQIVFDPLFWQALGKACRWTTQNTTCNKCGVPFNGWKGKALRFHEINLNEGWNKAVSYVEELIK